jgi:hypothetical protein|tara:strand:- start:3387 stop:4361 length:975 start_codon:yes stop_codon:yes gene_type:complete
MALTPKNSKHALQILAGTTGRKKGHEFEFDLAELVNSAGNEIDSSNQVTVVFNGTPALALIKKCLNVCGWDSYDTIEAIPLGALATAEGGKKWLEVNDVKVKASKSDILLNIYRHTDIKTIGVSVKQCLAEKPTNPQLFLSTARAFCKLLRRNNIPVSEFAETAMRQFCGDKGFRPIDDAELMRTRISNPVRFYWEEINTQGLNEWESLLKNKQDGITRLLLQKAYLDDPFSPEVIIQKTRKVLSGPEEFSIYSIDELVSKSRDHARFIKTLKTEVSKSKSYDVPKGVKHECPKFGIVQMQRFGNKQNATQLQFNLQAGYFYKI